jgi:hypothetical protein
MTKVRLPLTPHAALCEVVKVLGYDGCAEVTGKKEWSLRKMSDPDTGREISLRDAMRLDAAYRRAGGSGSPFFECYAGFLGIDEAEQPESPMHLMTLSGEVSKEVGEAVAAAITAAHHANCPAARARAIDEAREGLGKIQALVASLEKGNIHER